MNPFASDRGQRSFGFAVRRAHRAFDKALQRRLAPHGIAPGYWYYLRALWDQDGLTQKQLSDRIGVAENTTTAMVAAMMKDGLVTRTRAVDDKRKWRIALTPRAQELREELFPYALEVNKLAATGIELADGELFLALIERMTANLDRDETEEATRKGGGV